LVSQIIFQKNICLGNKNGRDTMLASLKNGEGPYQLFEASRIYQKRGDAISIML
jgi:hypothetical protein